MQSIKFGDKIRVTEKYFRAFDKRKRVWKTRAITPVEVYIIGIRTLRNGIVSGGEWGEDDPLNFETTETIKAYLVCEGLRKKPFYVPMTQKREPNTKEAPMKLVNEDWIKDWPVLRPGDKIY